MREASNSGASTIIPSVCGWGGSQLPLGWLTDTDIMGKNYRMNWGWGGMTMGRGCMIRVLVGLILWIPV